MSYRKQIKEILNDYNVGSDQDEFDSITDDLNYLMEKHKTPWEDISNDKEGLKELEEEFKEFHALNGAGWEEPWNWILSHAKEIGELV